MILAGSTPHCQLDRHSENRDAGTHGVAVGTVLDLVGGADGPEQGRLTMEARKSAITP